MLFTTSSTYKAIYPSGCKGKADFQKKTVSTIRDGMEEVTAVCKGQE